MIFDTFQLIYIYQWINVNFMNFFNTSKIHICNFENHKLKYGFSAFNNCSSFYFYDKTFVTMVNVINIAFI